MNRRNFVKSIGAVPLITASSTTSNDLPIIKPPRLKTGDTVGLICPAAPAYNREELKSIEESMQALGLNLKYGKNFWNRYGYLAGTDPERAADVNTMFADESVKMILCVHGGWGCARILPLLDYNLIRSNPKIIIGYSDVTALLLGIHAKTGLVTFHGPVGSSTWNKFSVDFFKKVLMLGEEVTMQNPIIIGDNLAQTNDRISTINSGITQGKLLGGNLTVLSHLIGTEYVPDWESSIFFAEDIGEAPYSVDRMITHLKLAGVFDKINGFVFGKCTDCKPGSGGYGSLTLEDIWRDHIQPSQKPAFTGAMIGHIEDKFTIPIGINAEINADKGTIRLLEAAVL
ncbi:MAG: LD-carboxypeptidase [Spirosomaceae bacterium]|nr:LD-carboxypeptidase [Spirosomataceae bacterium]